MKQLSVKRIVLGVFGGILMLFILWNMGSIWEDVGAGEIVVVQDPIDGELHVYTQPGMVSQSLGKATHYKKSFQYWFDGAVDHAPMLAMKFYDGGHASIPGSGRVDMPLDIESILKIHTRFGSMEAIQSQVIGQALINAATMSGPTMTSKESYAEKKNSLAYYIEDQAAKGVYKTTQKDVKVTDALTGQEKIATAVEILIDKKGLPLRQENSMVLESNIRLSNITLGDFIYDDVVKKQIAMQQEQSMRVQTGIANAKRAEQDAITVEQQGKADAAKAKWDQEVLKAKAVTEAEQKLAVATLNRKTEEQNKLALTQKGEGEANYKRAVTSANNNLELRLTAWVDVNKAYADAMSQSQWVPTYVMGGNGNNSSGAASLIEMMMAKTAKDMNIEMKSTK